MQMLLQAVQIIARAIGYFVATIGWVLFGIGVYCLADAGPSPWIAEHFRQAGCWIVPGWLFLRFGAGLFPFGRKLYKAPARKMP